MVNHKLVKIDDHNKQLDKLANVEKKLSQVATKEDVSLVHIASALYGALNRPVDALAISINMCSSLMSDENSGDIYKNLTSARRGLESKFLITLVLLILITLSHILLKYR